MKKETFGLRWWLLAAMISLLVFVLAACQPSTTTPAATDSTAAPTSSSATQAPATTAAAATAPATTAAAATPVAAGTQAPAGTPAPTPTPFVLAGAKTTASGLQYLELVAGKGASPKKGDLLTVHYIASLTDGTELANTNTDGKPETAVWGRNQLLAGWEEGLGLMKEGGKTKLVLPPALAFGEEGNGVVPPNAQVILEVELLKVQAPPMPATVAEDKWQKTENGVLYYDLVKGDGQEVAAKHTVSNHFTLWIKNATGYDYVVSSDGATPLTFVVGAGDKVFPGWEEGVIGMKVGGKRLLVVPPELGLGDQSSTEIPANSTLVIEVTMVSTREPAVATKVDPKDYTTTTTGLKYYDMKVGTGDTPKSGDTVTVHYSGWLQDGTQFDSSLDRGEPITFQVGTNAVIPGWDEGLSTMKAGGKRQLLIPPDLAYGAEGAGGVIPANATLIFDVELIKIESTPAK